MKTAYVNHSSSKKLSVSDREEQIIKLLKEGNRTKSIAQKLDISPRTVDNVIFNLRDKVGAQTRDDLKKLVHLCKDTNNPTKLEKRLKMNWLFGIFLLLTSFMASAFFIVESQEVLKDSRQDGIEWNLPKNLTVNIKRDDIVDQVWEVFNNADPFQMVTLSGLSGVGKTTIAKQIVSSPQVHYDLICWFSGESKQLLEEEYIELGERYNLFSKEIKNSVKIKIVKEWIGNHERSLVVFDNINQLKDLHNFIPKTGHVLITTVRQNFPGNTINVHSMTDDQAYRLLKSLLPSHLISDEADILKIINQLSGLPIAISQAGSYMRHLDIESDQFLAEFKTHQKAYVLEKQPSDDLSHVPVYVSWSLNMNTLSHLPQGKKILKLLNYISQFYPENIPRAILESLSTDGNYSTKMHVDDLINELKNFSLISTDPSNVSIHRLLQEFIDLKIPEEEKVEIQNHIFATLKRFFDTNYNNSKKHDEIKKLIPHVEYLNNLITEKNGIGLLIEFHVFCARFYEFVGNYNLRTEYWQKVANLSSQETEKRAYYKALSDYELSRVYIREGNYFDAIALLKKCLRFPSAIKEKYPDILYHLGWAYIRLYDCKNAVGYAELAVESSIKLNGKDHYKTADAMNDLGWIYLNMGEYQKAKNVLKKALNIHKTHYGENHLETMKILKSYSLVLLKTKDISNARSGLQRVLEARQTHYGQNHIKTANLFNEIGVLELEEGNFNKGLKILLENRKRIEKFYDEDHIFTSIAKINLAVAYRLNGNKEKSRSILQSVLPRIENFYGKNSIVYAVVLMNIELLNRPENQKNIDFISKIFKENLSEEHEYLSTLHQLNDENQANLPNISQGFFLIL